MDIENVIKEALDEDVDGFKLRLDELDLDFDEVAKLLGDDINVIVHTIESIRELISWVEADLDDEEIVRKYRATVLTAYLRGVNIGLAIERAATVAR